MNHLVTNLDHRRAFSHRSYSIVLQDGVVLCLLEERLAQPKAHGGYTHQCAVVAGLRRLDFETEQSAVTSYELCMIMKALSMGLSFLVGWRISKEPLACPGFGNVCSSPDSNQRTPRFCRRRSIAPSARWADIDNKAFSCFADHSAHCSMEYDYSTGEVSLRMTSTT